MTVEYFVEGVQVCETVELEYLVEGVQVGETTAAGGYTIPLQHILQAAQ